MDWLYTSYFSLRILLTTILLLVFGNIQAQLFSGTNKKNSNGNNITSDTTTKKQRLTNDSIVIFYYTQLDTTQQKPDSSFEYLNNSPILNKWETDLGNFGSSANSVYFNPVMLPSNKLGIKSNHSNLYNQENIKFLNTTKPYTDLYYRIGTKQEQIIEVIHSRNITPRWNLSAAYRKTGSPGSYKFQRTNNDNFSLTSNYNSVNQRYISEAFFIYNKIQQDENGGIFATDYLFASNYNDKRLVPVILDGISTEKNRSTVTNYFRDVNFKFNHQYFFGKKDSVLSADSSEIIYSFTPQFGLKHSIYASGSLYRYKDLTPDTTFYRTLGILSFAYGDSVHSKYEFNEIGNTFSLTGEVRFRQKTMKAEAGYGIEIDKVNNATLTDAYLNNFLFATVVKNASQEKEWLYNGGLKFYFTGNLIGNLLLSAEAGKNISAKAGQVKIGFEQAVQTTPFMNLEYYSNYFSLQGSNNKQTISKLKLSYLNPKYKASVKLNYYLLTNYVYRDTNLTSKQYVKAIPLSQLQASKLLTFRNFNFENDLLLQFISTNAPIHLPIFSACSRLYYKKSILKSKLGIATGFNIRYNTPFYTDAYSPIVYDFVTQYQNKLENVPRVDYFFNFKVKTFRGFLGFSEIQQLFTRNNINYQMYPAQNFMFRFGFHWMFVN